VLEDLLLLGERYCESDKDIHDWIYLAALIYIQHMKRHIESAVASCSHIDISATKRLIKGVVTKSKDSESLLLKPWQYEVKQLLRGRLFFYCSNLLVERKRTFLQGEIHSSLSRFDSKRPILEDNLNNMIHMACGDRVSGWKAAEAVANRVKAALSERASTTHVERTRKSARLSESKLVEKCHEMAFNPCTSEKLVFLYATNFLLFQSKAFNEHFSMIANEEKTQIVQSTNNDGKNILTAVDGLATELRQMLMVYPHWDKLASGEEVQEATTEHVQDATEKLVQQYILTDSPLDSDLQMTLAELNALLQLDGAGVLRLPNRPPCVRVLHESNVWRDLDGKLGAIKNPVVFLQAFSQGLR